MHFSKHIIPLFLLVLSACTGVVPVNPTGPVEVGVNVCGGGDAILTRTIAGEDGLSTTWTENDELALWALDGSGSAVLDAQKFHVASVMGTSAFFTSTLASQMDEGNYSYFACSPYPTEVSGGKAYFSIPASQDGHCSDGSDVMFSDVAVSGSMKPIDWLNYGHEELNLAMNHLLHRMRFYLTDNSSLNGENIKEISVTFPRNVVGRIAVNLDDPRSAELVSDAGNTVSVILDKPLQLSTSSKRNYVNISILPTSFSSGEKMSITLHTVSKLATFDIPLKGRTFAAGHSTPVLLIPQNVVDAPRIYFRLNSNHLGEEVEKITLTAPDGCTWGDGTSSEYVFSPAGGVPVGTSFHVEFHNLAKFNAFSGKNVTVTYDSEHVTISETVSVGNIIGKSDPTLGMNVPYLLYENFSSVATFSSDDEYKTSKAGSYSATSFLNGWAGARCGAEAGKCIRIACRRETSSDYPARVDSAPLNGKLKKAANLSVRFDYGANNQFGGLAIVADGNVGQNCHIGYITTTKNYKSGDDDGTYESGNSFYIKEYSGSYDSTPNNDTYILHDVPAADVVRVSWRTTIEHQAGTTNTTAWLYLDNIIIQISKQ